MNRILKLLMGSTVLTTVGACTVGVVADAEKTIQKDRNDTHRLVEASARPLPKKEVGPISISNDVWLGSKAIMRRHGEPLPVSVERDGVTLYSSLQISLDELPAIIKKATGIQVIIDKDVAAGSAPSPSESSSFEVGPADDSEGEGEGASEGGAEEAAEDLFSGEEGGSSSSRQVIYFDVNHQGKLSEFLNSVANLHGISWEYEDGVIRFYRNVNKTFLMTAMPGAVTNSVAMSSVGGSEEAGSASQSTSFSYSLDIWNEMISSISALAASGGGSVVASQSTGTISVSADMQVMKKVERLIQETNDRFSQQITVNVKVLSVSLSDGDRFATDISGLNLDNALFDGAFSRAAAAGTGSLSYTLLKPSRLDGVSGIIDALSTKGDVSVVTSSNATTMNNVPTPVQVSNTQGYVSEITVTESDDGTEVTLAQDEVTSGFSMNVLPRVLANGVVGMNYSISISELIGAEDGFNTFTVAGATLQLKDVNTRSFAQQVMVPNGSTLVLSGFEQQKNTVSKNGFGVAENWLMGGENEGNMSREMMVILVTPVIVDGEKLIQELK